MNKNASRHALGLERQNEREKAGSRVQGHLITAHLFQLSLGITQSVTHPRAERVGTREMHTGPVEDVARHIGAEACTPERVAESLRHDLASHQTHSTHTFLFLRFHPAPPSCPLVPLQ